MTAVHAIDELLQAAHPRVYGRVARVAGLELERGQHRGEQRGLGLTPVGGGRHDAQRSAPDPPAASLVTDVGPPAATAAERPGG